MTPTVVDSTNYADASYRSEDVQKKVSPISGSPKMFQLDEISSFLAPLCPDDADAGEIKKSHKSVRRRQREGASNQKQEEATKRQWESHRSSVSSHSSGDEVLRSLWSPVLYTIAQ